MNRSGFLISIFLGLLLNNLSVSIFSQENSGEKKEASIYSKYRNFPVNWWEKYENRDEKWFASERAITMADNILSWQTEYGGWPLMNTTNEPWTGDVSAIGPWGRNGTILHATTNEIRFLSKVYNATGEERFKVALTKGIDYVLKAQTKTGGWPKSFPVHGESYHRHITFNDGAMINALTLLGEIGTESEYSYLDEDFRALVRERYKLGVDCILRCQIISNGQLTAWCQQHDEENYEPRPGRAFEPAAISGGESASVLLYLMSIRNPSDDIIQAVEAGVKWYRDSRINGWKLIRSKNDQWIEPDSSAPAMWARFYEIGTNRPVFAGRDGIIRYNLNEIEKERRGGYSWYNYNGTKVFERYEEWRHERKWDDQPPTNTDESKTGVYALPDPLLSLKGKHITSEKMWKEERRPEILDLFMHHQHGVTPSDSIKYLCKVVERDVPWMNGLARRTQFRISFPEFKDGPEIRVLLNVPSNANGPVPTLLHISFTPNALLYDEGGVDEGMSWNVRRKIRVPDRKAMDLQDIDPGHFIKKGYAVATVYYGDIEPDFDQNGKYGVSSMFKKTNTRKPDEWGAIGAWAWGLSRVMDCLEKEPAVDDRQVALSGVSRLGKTILWAAAQDERFAMVIPMLSGEGGAAISRRNYGETVADLTNPYRYDYWYAPRYSDYAFQPSELPVDGHMLITLIAPRPILQIVGSLDTWSDPRGEWEAAIAAEPVFLMYGKKGLNRKNFIEPGERILNDMGFFMHEGKHTVLPEDFEVMTDFMDSHFTNQAPRQK